MDSRGPDGVSAQEERELIRKAQAGDRKAMEALVKIHQPWVFNTVLRMLPDFHEAEDASQEILMKAVVNLPSFKGESGLRTWLYRISLNHVLDMRKDGCERSIMASLEGSDDDEAMGAFLARGIPDAKGLPHDLSLLAKELMVKCTLAMLLCLGRRARMAFILGDILAVDGKTGAEVMGTSEAAFRKTLSRARRRLFNFLNDRCGLVNPGKPCSCDRATLSGLALGWIDPLVVAFAAEDAPAVRDIAASARRRLDAIELERCRELYRSQPFARSRDFSKKVMEIVESEDFKGFLDAAPVGA